MRGLQRPCQRVSLDAAPPPGVQGSTSGSTPPRRPRAHLHRLPQQVEIDHALRVRVQKELPPTATLRHVVAQRPQLPRARIET